METSTSVLGIANSLFERRLCSASQKKQLQRASRSPCQDRFFWGGFRGSKKGPKNGTAKGAQSGPQMGPKKAPRGTKRVLKVGSRKGSRKGYHSGRVNSEILLLFTVFQQGRAFQKSITLGYLFGTILRPKVAQKGSYMALQK